MLDELVELGFATSFDDLPASAVEATSTFLLDSLAVGVAGRAGTWRDAVLGVARSWGDGTGARLLGDGTTVAPAAAAFVNTFQMHCLEFDCVHEAAVAHAMTAVAGAALAECEQNPVDGARLTLALALGVEVAAVLGMAADAPLRFFRPATAGVFAAAAAVGVLRRYDGPRLRLCFGHALGHAAGTMQAHAEGKPTLAIQFGAAARSGMAAADLAGAGVPAPRDALEGPYGYFPLFESGYDTRAVAADIGRVWRVTELSHKPWPAGRATHGGVEGVLRLRARGLSADNLESLVLAAPPLVHQLVVRPPRDDMEAAYARLCFAYVGAVALRRGAVAIGDFRPEALRDPDTLALGRRISACREAVADPAAFCPQTLRARLRDGTQLAVRVEALAGSPQRPLGRDESEAKVRACLATAYSDPGRAERLIRTVRGLPGLADAAAVLEPVVGPPSASR